MCDYELNSLESITRKIETLQRQIESLKAENEEMGRMKSVSRIARKMYGDVVPGELTHADIALQYKNYFKEEHRSLPKRLAAVSKYKVWEMSSKIFQESFEVSKKQTIDLMISEIERALKSTSDEAFKSEDVADLCQAFRILLKESIEIDQFKKKVSSLNHDHDHDYERSLELATSVLFRLPVEQHRSAIQGKHGRSRTPSVGYMPVLRMK